MLINNGGSASLDVVFERYWEYGYMEVEKVYVPNAVSKVEGWTTTCCWAAPGK